MSDPSSGQKTVKLLHVVGTRPNFMKAAAVIAAAERWNRSARESLAATEPASPGAATAAVAAEPVRFKQVLVHTGQHYDEKMSRIFFDDLGLPRPHYDLEVGSGSHAEQTARVMMALEPVLNKEAPDLVITVGDVNSTMAAALVASKLNIPVAHVEAGLRSRDRTMPEELNRLITDQLSDLLFTTSRDADENLVAEGILSDKIHFVGNTMIDMLEAHLPRAMESPVGAEMGLVPGGYAVVTLHRPSNVDEEAGLERLVDVLIEVGRRLPVVFPVHARTRNRLAQFGLEERLHETHRSGAPASGGPASRLAVSVILCEPLGYLDFLGLMARARLVLTDSGGIQEETTVLGVPCLTLRKNTERPVTITEGTNRLVDPEDVGAIIAAAQAVLDAKDKPAANAIAVPGDGATASGVAPAGTPAGAASAPRRPQLWDGRAGDRIVAQIAAWAVG